MLVRSRVITALEAKKDRFAGYQVALGDRLNRYQEALRGLPSLSQSEIEGRLTQVDTDWPGARPTGEQDRLRDVVISFGERWPTHEPARAWARDVLLDHPTFAVDGSQIPPSRDLSVPVGAVQVGWFENPHARGSQYVKEITFEVLAPDELAGQPDAPASQSGQTTVSPFPDAQVNVRRFELECQTMVDYMEAHADAHPAPLCFFDGSLVVSFAEHMRPELRQQYVAAVTAMIRTSEESQVPLVGYVDTSYARDLITMLSIVFGLPFPSHLSDGGLLRLHMQWGDRCQVYQCARDDNVLPLYGPLAHRICFTYLKTTTDGQPARIELPCWIAEDEDQLAHVLDLIRAECVVGNGYPYALETADAVAVIKMEDRKRFYATFQQFAEKEGMSVRYSRKARSKQMRR